MNWLVFENAPAWYWLHALKPTYNSEASGYSLGYWRPPDDDNFSHFPGVQKGHWDYNQQNFNGIAWFLKYMPWDSQRIEVDEGTVRKDNRILAFLTPRGKLVLVLTNRLASPFQFNISTGRDALYEGHRYTVSARDMPIGKLRGSAISPVLPPKTIEFWSE